jgi:hypothetical protein
MKTIQEYFAELVAVDLAPDWKNVLAVGNASHQEWLFSDCELFPTLLNITLDNIPVDPYNDNIQLRSNGIDLVKLEWLPYEEDDDPDQEYWVLQHGMVGVSKCEYTNNGKPATKWGSDNPVLKKTHGDIAPKPEDFEEVLC